MKLKLVIFATLCSVVVSAIVFLLAIPAHAQQPQATVAKIVPFALAGPGPWLVVNANKQVVATVVAGQVVPLAVTFRQPAPVAIPTVRYQIENITSGARDEPATCSRGMKVLRYGFWGC